MLPQTLVKNFHFHTGIEHPGLVDKIDNYFDRQSSSTAIVLVLVSPKSRLSLK